MQLKVASTQLTHTEETRNPAHTEWMEPSGSDNLCLHCAMSAALFWQTALMGECVFFLMCLQEEGFVKRCLKLIWSQPSIPLWLLLPFDGYNEALSSSEFVFRLLMYWFPKLFRLASKWKRGNKLPWRKWCLNSLLKSLEPDRYIGWSIKSANMSLSPTYRYWRLCLSIWKFYFTE